MIEVCYAEFVCAIDKKKTVVAHNTMICEPAITKFYKPDGELVGMIVHHWDTETLESDEKYYLPEPSNEGSKA